MVDRQEGQAYAMSPCTSWSGSILATSSIALLHCGQTTASFRVVSDTTNLNSAQSYRRLLVTVGVRRQRLELAI